MSRNSALAYDLFEDEYSDAQDSGSVPRRPVNLQWAEDRTFEAGKDEAEKKDSVLVLAVKKLSDGEHKIVLREAIPVYIEGERGQYIALYEPSRICGEGIDVPAAFRDFENTFISVFLAYTQPTDSLSSGAKKYGEFLGRLVDHIEKI